ncbi:23S rRNA (uracil(1939)-C(5))-methyltransferase RlmD [Bacillota bacterium]
MLEKGERYQVEIIDVGSSGEGIGRVDGIAVFIHGAITGDKVLAEIKQIKKNYAKGEIVKLLAPSPDRTEPLCQYADSCGGCSFQSMNYRGQIALKKKWIRDCLTRIGGIEDPLVRDVITMDDPWNYRNKVQLAIGRISGHEKKQRGCDIGFFKRGTHDVINCQMCLLQAKPVEAVAGAVREYVKESKAPVFDETSGTGVLKGLMVKTAFGTGEIMVVVDAALRRIPETKLLAEKIQDAIEALSDGMTEGEGRYSFESLILNVNPGRGPVSMRQENIVLAGKPTIKDRLMGLDFEISPNSFYQINPSQTEKLYEKVREYADLTGRETVLDLYCGVGTIGLLLAGDAGRVIGVESIKAAVIDANRNAVINGIVNAEFICGKAENELPVLIDQGIRADVVVLDPPRAGCQPELLAAAASAGPERIIYVSCDPATLARDIKILTQLGYRFIEAQPVDMFPWTGHVECVVCIQKRNDSDSSI